MFFKKIIDRVKPWIINFNNKIKFRVVLGIVAAKLLVVLLAIGYFLVKKSVFFRECYSRNDLAIMICFAILLNSFYLIISQLRNFSCKVKSRISNKYHSQKKLEYLDLAAIYKLGQGYAAVLKSGESVIWSKTLNQSLNELPDDEYFLINRSDIVNRFIIEGYQGTESRRLKLILKKPLNNQKDFIVSQRKVVEFKNWYRNKFTH